ncbi:MAG: hypothetical protein AB7D37_14180 [Desulfovibrio sp.]|uniref:Uncharacterized protein n=1 Tax=Solidesulfovibrio fructosivorans JJ] TaxID=596151 RepID=E1JZM9_SOLFR|nr:hypothetical protein [Solidesulfovibrio fructosivorans]EFL50164.1 hypothetical protein DesfrDRAFT_3079 [Solidesulfovibrio fructosivorans JJ]]
MHGFYEYGTFGGGLISFLITLAILALIFLVCREIVCWYWKINRAMELLERQNLLLERIEAKISAVSGSNGKTS